MSWFQHARAPEGRCEQACLYNRVLSAELISKMSGTFDLIRLIFENDEDRGSASIVVL